MERERKTIIAGTGRCGTSCLVQLLTRAGLDTGLVEGEDGSWRLGIPQKVLRVDPNDGRVLSVSRKELDHQEVFSRKVNAGCEILVCPEDSPEFVKHELPEVIKDPRLAWCGHQLIDAGILDIRHMIVCVRDLESVAASKKDGMPKHDTGRWYQHSFEKIYDISAWQLGVCVAEMTTRDVPLTFLKFPRFVEDFDYFLQKMLEVFPLTAKLKASDLLDAWKGTVRKELVHYR